jgi:hypothetical protein
LLAGGTWVRWVHLGTPSLWWDEIVHARIASQPSVPQVWRMAQNGAAPGMGNAGAVPLDYLALHAWLAWTPAPPPDALERHYRMPAFAFAVAALPLAWLVGRALGGPVVGLVALGLLATSMPHVLYAAEARFYSLYVLATLANLAAFVALVRAPSAGRAALFTLAAVGLVMSGLYGVFPVAAEYLVLAALAWSAGGARLVVATVVSALVVAGGLATWITPSSIAASYGRGAPAALDVRSAVESTLLFFSGYVPWLAAAFGLALLVAPFVVRRDRVTRAVTIAFVLSTAAFPAMVAIAHAKQYYFHPRHALFLLPMAHLAAACVLGTAITGLVRAPRAALVVAAILGVAGSAPAIASFVDAPLPYFQATKTLRDFRGLARLIAARTAGAPPAARWELLLAKGRPGHLANPTLAFYLDVWGLTDRVLLGGVSDPAAVVAKLPAACPTRCRGPSSIATLADLGVTDPFDQASLMRDLMQLRPNPWMTEWSGLSVIVWTPATPIVPPPSVAETRLDGMTIYDPR